MTKLTVVDLSELIPCVQCGRLTFAKDKLPDYYELPAGYSSDNERQVYGGVLVCTRCWRKLKIS